MEQRKIQEIGGGTFTVSLPREWADSVELEKGSIVNLHQYPDGIIAIQTQESENEARDSICVPIDAANTESLGSLIRRAYVVGYDSVTFEADDEITHDQRQALLSTARQFQGVNVSEERDSKITVRVLLNSEEVSVPQLIRQMKFVVLSAYDDAIASLAGEKSPTTPDTSTKQANRVYATTERTLQRALARLDEVERVGLTRPELFQLWGTAYELKQVAGHVQRIYNISTSDVDFTCSDQLLDVAQLSRTIIQDGVSTIVGEAEMEVARRTVLNRTKVRDKIEQLDERLVKSSSADYRTGCVLESVKWTAEHGGNIAERSLQLALHRRVATETSLSGGGANDRARDSQTP